MKLSAIFQNKEFIGVVETDRVEDLTKEAGITDYNQIDDVRVETRSDCRGDDGVVYWNAYEQIDDLHGGSGNTVVRNHGK